MNKEAGVHVGVVGGGFSGLSAADELAKQVIAVTVFEAEAEIGGLVAAFDVNGEKLDRVRLGLLALRARRVKNWMELENKTVAEWLKELGGEQVCRIIWEPLLKGKFGNVAEQISAVWFWNKLKLRGGSRGKGGGERLVYLKGGFIALAEALVARIRELGGEILLNARVKTITPYGAQWQLDTPQGCEFVDKIIVTTALPLVAEMIKTWAEFDYVAIFERIHYLANVCLVLELDRSLSKTYWLNVNEPNFPFVGVIEHTNFESAASYGGRHIVYFSKYLFHNDALYKMNNDEMMEFAFPYLQKMFPALQRSWISKHHLWRARWSQPVVEKNYSQLIPSAIGPLPGFYLASMAQIYPEDRGTNYAIREGRRIAQHLLQDVK